MNNVTTIMHKVDTTQDICGSPDVGLRPPTLLLILSFFKILTGNDHQNPTSWRTGDLHTPRQILLPKLVYNTDPSTVYAQSAKNNLHLASQISTYTKNKASYNTFT
jgi:hypothetical protein